MFNQKTIKKLQNGFQKGKLKGLSGINPQRLSLSFTPPVDNHGMNLRTVRIKFDQRELCSFGFGQVPHKDYGVMFTMSPNPQGYDLATINQKIKPLKVQASLSTGQLLLLIRLKDEKSFFDCVSKLLKASKYLTK